MLYKGIGVNTSSENNYHELKIDGIIMLCATPRAIKTRKQIRKPDNTMPENHNISALCDN
jgi:hypothetical protein